MLMKFATIVIPVYNRADTIERCLDSMVIQSEIDRFSIVVVDNCSEDNSLDVIKAWCRRHNNIDVEILSESKRGAAAARNCGLRQVATEYVMFFDSDDEMRQGHLERIVKSIENYPEIDIFGWDIEYKLADGSHRRSLFKADDALKNHLIFDSLATLRYVARTSLVRKAGGWNEQMKGWDDFELGVRLLLENPLLKKIDSAKEPLLVVAYYSDNSITGLKFSSNPTKWEAALDEVEKRIAERQPKLLPWVGFRRAQLAGQYYREGAITEAHRLLADAPIAGFGTIKARMIYWFTCLVGRGARCLASLIIFRT